MARLEVEIVADTKGADRVVRSLKEIRQASGETATSMNAVGATSKKINASLSATATAATGAAGAYSALTVAATRQGLALQTNLAANTETVVSLGATAAATTRQTTLTKLLSTAYTRLSVAATTATASVLAFGRAATGAVLRKIAQAGAAAAKALTLLGNAMGGLTLAAGGLVGAFAFGIGAGIKSAVDLEKTFSRIEGLVGIAADEVEAFKKPLLDIARATAKGPNELAEALFFVTSAGFEGAEALDILEASAKAAAAGLGETKTVADAVTSAVNAYGIENLKASEATDILVATVREGKAEADSIAGALGQILPAASELGVEFSELGGTIAALTRIGLGAEQGATALGATLAAIQKPGKDAKDTLLQFGTSAAELRRSVREEGLLPALQSLKESFGDNEEALTKVFPNIRALRAILPLVGKNAGDVADIFESVADATNATDDAFAAYAKTTSFTLAEAQVALEISMQKLGEDLLPAVAAAFVAIASGVDKTISAFQTLGETIAELKFGSDDPLTRLKDDLESVRSNIERLDGSGFLGQIGADSAAFGNQGEVVAGAELSGSAEDQLKILRGVEEQILRNIAQTEKETAQREALANATQDQADILEEIVITAQKRGGSAKLIDDEALEKGREALAELRGDVQLFAADLANLNSLGESGIGLAEDAAEASVLFTQLQGQVAITEDEVLQLVAAKRQLAEQIDQVNQRFAEQAQAVETVEEIRRSIEATQELMRAAAEGEQQFINVEALQQAREIFAALPADTELTVEAIQSLILAEQALNSELDTTVGKFKDSNDIIEQFSIQAARNIQTGFAEFLFDPFSDGLDGMVFKFAESLKKIAAEILANQILTSFFNSLSGLGGPLGGFASSALSVIGGNQFGGRVQAGQAGIVNETLSAKGEVFVPATDGRVVTKQQAAQAIGDGAGGGQAPPQVNITNVTDPAAAVQALETNAGQQAIINIIRSNPSAIKRALT